MRSKIAAVLGIMIFLSTAGLSAYESRQWIGVAPFANLGNNTEADYIGFQVAEYLSNVLPGYPGVRLVSCRELLKTLDDWDITLGGLAAEGGKDILDVGHILNLTRMIVGTFELTKNRLRLSGFIVDIRTGVRLSEAVVVVALSDSYLGAYRLFFTALTADLPEYDDAPGIRARMTILDESWNMNEDAYSMALASHWSKDEEKARDFLEKALGGALLPFPGYVDAAELLLNINEKTGAESRYPDLIRKAITRNKDLADHFFALSIYRDTLRQLKTRIESLLDNDSIRVSGDPSAAVKIVKESDHVKVVLPKTAALELKPQTLAEIASLVSRQEAVKLGRGGLTVAPYPEGELLRPIALSGGFDLSVRAGAALSVRFLDGRGATIFSLSSPPAEVVSLQPGIIRYQAAPERWEIPRIGREGWTLLPDGTLQISSAEFALIKSIQYAVDPSGFRFSVSFPMDSDANWNSLIAHAYRKISGPLSFRNERQNGIKDVVVSDAFFLSADRDLGLIPILPRNGRIAGFTQTVAAVYLADAANGPVSAAWSGLFSASSSSRGKNAKTGNVLYFEAPESAAPLYGTVVFEAKASEEKDGVSAAVFLGNGGGWTKPDQPNVFAAAGKYLVADNGVAYSITDGSRRWDCQKKGYPVLYDEGTVILLGPSAMYRIEKESGRIIAETPYVTKGRIFSAKVDGNDLYILSEFGGFEAMDLTNSSRIWYSRLGDVRTFATASGYAYAGNGTVYDLRSGAVLFQTEGRGAAAITAAFAVWENGVCVERSSGKRSWRLPNTRGTPSVVGDVAFFGGHTAVSIDTGTVLWKNGAGGNEAFLADGKLFSWNGKRLIAIDQGTGVKLWSCYGDSRSALIAEDSLFDSLDSGGLVRRDLSVFGRVLSPDAYASRGRLAADLVNVAANATLRSGVFVSNLVLGEAPEGSGLQCGDYLLEIDTQQVQSMEHALDLFFERKKDDPVRLKIARQDSRGSWIESTVITALGGMGDPLERRILRPGFRLGTIDRARIRELKLDNLARFDSFIVDSVFPRTAALDAGLALGDILLQVNSVPLNASFLEENFKRLYSVVASAMRLQSSLSFTVIRDGVRRTLPPFKP